MKKRKKKRCEDLQVTFIEQFTGQREGNTNAGYKSQTLAYKQTVGGTFIDIPALRD